MYWFKKIVSWWNKVWGESEDEETQPELNLDNTTDRIELISWGSRSIHFKGKVRDWPEQNGDLSGNAILEIFRDGRWQGGKFEHCRNNMTSRGWENIKLHEPENNRPYGIFKIIRPRLGEKARFKLESYDCTKYTNWLEGVWQ